MIYINLKDSFYIFEKKDSTKDLHTLSIRLSSNFQYVVFNNAFPLKRTLSPTNDDMYEEGHHNTMTISQSKLLIVT